MKRRPTEKCANLVHLSGWLVIDDARAIPLNGHQAFAIRGYIHTEKPATGDTPPVDTSYPVLFAGEPADIVLAWARLRSDKPIKMAISGNLFRKFGRCYVRVRYVDILEVATGPLDDERERRPPSRPPSRPSSRR